MDNILELLTKRVERELNATKCVVDIFKVQNLKKLKRKDGTYWHNKEFQHYISRTIKYSMDTHVSGCNIRLYCYCKECAYFKCKPKIHTILLHC